MIFVVMIILFDRRLSSVNPVGLALPVQYVLQATLVPLLVLLFRVFSFLRSSAGMVQVPLWWRRLFSALPADNDYFWKMNVLSRVASSVGLFPPRTTCRLAWPFTTWLAVLYSTHSQATGRPTTVIPVHSLVLRQPLLQAYEYRVGSLLLTTVHTGTARSGKSTYLCFSRRMTS